MKKLLALAFLFVAPITHATDTFGLSNSIEVRVRRPFTLPIDSRNPAGPQMYLIEDGRVTNMSNLNTSQRIQLDQRSHCVLTVGNLPTNLAAPGLPTSLSVSATPQTLALTHLGQSFRQDPSQVPARTPAHLGSFTYSSRYQLGGRGSHGQILSLFCIAGEGEHLSGADVFQQQLRGALPIELAAVQDAQEGAAQPAAPAHKAIPAAKAGSAH